MIDAAIRRLAHTALLIDGSGFLENVCGRDAQEALDAALLCAAGLRAQGNPGGAAGTVSPPPSPPTPPLSTVTTLLGSASAWVACRKAQNSLHGYLAVMVIVSDSDVPAQSKMEALARQLQLYSRILATDVGAEFASWQTLHTSFQDKRGQVTPVTSPRHLLCWTQLWPLLPIWLALRHRFNSPLF